MCLTFINSPLSVILVYSCEVMAYTVGELGTTYFNVITIIFITLLMLLIKVIGPFLILVYHNHYTLTEILLLLYWVDFNLHALYKCITSQRY